MKMFSFVALLFGLALAQGAKAETLDDQTLDDAAYAQSIAVPDSLVDANVLTQALLNGQIVVDKRDHGGDGGGDHGGDGGGHHGGGDGDHNGGGHHGGGDGNHNGGGHHGGGDGDHNGGGWHHGGGDHNGGGDGGHHGHHGGGDGDHNGGGHDGGHHGHHGGHDGDHGGNGGGNGGHHGDNGNHHHRCSDGEHHENGNDDGACVPNGPQTLACWARDARGLSYIAQTFTMNPQHTQALALAKCQQRSPAPRTCRPVGCRFN